MARWANDTIAPSQRSTAGWGHQIRSYVDGKFAKDLRTGVIRDLDATLNGDLDDFLKAALTLPKRAEGAAVMDALTR